MSRKKIIIVEPHGFCSGVRRAIETVNAALNLYPPPVYCLNEIVHNPQVVNELAAKGVCFIGDLDKIPRKSNLLFSAHGVSPAVRAAARQKGINVIDATCPFVSKVHVEARRYVEDGCSVLIIGDRNHEEVAGVAGEAGNEALIIENEEDARNASVSDPDRVGVVCQTTLMASYSNRIMEILRSRFPLLRTPEKSDICYATQNRQLAVRILAKKADLIMVIGSRNSANTRRLVETGEASGCPSVLVSNIRQLDDIPLAETQTVGLTSGASTPESFLESVAERLASMGFKKTERLIAVEEGDHRFPLPIKVT